MSDNLVAISKKIVNEVAQEVEAIEEAQAAALQEWETTILRRRYRAAGFPVSADAEKPAETYADLATEIRATPPIRDGALAERIADLADSIITHLTATYERDGSRTAALDGAGCTIGYQVLEDIYRALVDTRDLLAGTSASQDD